jgi:hypothetical protein
MRRIRACLCGLLCVVLVLSLFSAVYAEGVVVTRGYVGFVLRPRVYHRRRVSYYADVYAYNHKAYDSVPFDAAVPERFFVVDGQGGYALAPVVLDVTDTMRKTLYGGDIGKVAMYYGQYAEKVWASNRKWGYSGIHEGIDFIAEKGQPLYALLAGEVTRAGGDKDGTVAVYNEQYNATILYLHVTGIKVKKGDLIVAGTQIGVEGRRGAGAYYTHVEVRFGRHTSPSPYQNLVLESDLPYDFLAKALNVTPSDREPVTAEAIYEAEQLRLAAAAEAEAARVAAEEEAWRLSQPSPAPTPEPVVREDVDTGIPDDFGFATEAP